MEDKHTFVILERKQFQNSNMVHRMGTVQYSTDSPYYNFLEKNKNKMHALSMEPHGTVSCRIHIARTYGTAL